MKTGCAKCAAGPWTRAFEAIAFGDLFLADIRAYREKQLAGTGLEPIFPVWQLPTGRTRRRDHDSAGLRAKITCIDPKVLSPGLRAATSTRFSRGPSRHCGPLRRER